MKMRLLWLLLAGFLAGCWGNRNEVKLTGVSFGDEIELRQNLVFNFNKQLVPDSLIDVWDTIPYINFTPEIPGKFKWTAPGELVFSPSVGFEPATWYEALITREILTRADPKLKMADMEAIRFNTPFLKLAGTNAYWGNHANPGTGLRLALTFNHPVDPVSLKEFLNVGIRNKKVNVTVITTEVSNEIVVSLNGYPRMAGKTGTIDLMIGKGVVNGDKKIIQDEDIVTTVSIPDPTSLGIANVTSSLNENQGFVRVRTSHTLEPGDLAKFVKISPFISYETGLHDDGFFIKAAFSQRNYTLTISEGLPGSDGARLDKPFVHDLNFRSERPYISFTSSSGMYLSSAGQKNVGINISGVPKVKVVIYKVFDNNILHYLYQNGIESNYIYGFERFGSTISERIYETKNLPKSGASNLLNLAFSDSLKTRGLYVVHVSSTDNQWLGTARLVSISDIGLIVRQAEDEVLVFANSISTAKPIPGAKIDLISVNNQFMQTATTGKDGVVTFKGISQKNSGFVPAMVTASLADESNYMAFSYTGVDLGRFETGGYRSSEAGYMAFIYGDRDIYRPGETASFNTIIRNNDWSLPGEVPVKMRILLPNGRELKKLKGTLNRQGAYTFSLPLSAATQTGTYSLSVYSANDVFIGSRTFTVEEFMPDRIKVKLATDKPGYFYKDTIKADVEAVNLFGPPAANRKYEMDFSLERKVIQPAAYAQFEFGVQSREKIPILSEIRQGTTDSKGKARESFRIPDVYVNTGLYSARIHTTVFDESGRPVNQVKSFDCTTQNIYYGIKRPGYYAPVNQALELPLVAVDKSGKPQSGTKARVQVVRYIWHHYYMRHHSGYDAESQRQEQVLADEEIIMGADPVAFKFIPRISGQYEVRVMKPGTKGYVSVSFYSYGWGYSEPSSFEMSNDGQVDISFDKEKYKIGDKATVLFKTPFSGKLLVTLERDRIFEYHYIETDKKAAQLTFNVTDVHIPNVYLTATLIRPIDESKLPLTVAHGFASVPVSRPADMIPVTLVAQAKSRSKTRQTVVIRTIPKSDIEVTIAVVDEGILQLKNYKTPDPWSYFYQKRALAVKGYDIYTKVFPEMATRKLLTGGDGEEDASGYNLEKRTNPMGNKRVKLVSYWSGILRTNARGEVSYTFDVPQFSGDLRIMALAYKDRAFGSGDVHMKVADPVVISTSLPRFLTPGDSLDLPVTLSNTTSGDSEAKITVTATGAVKISGSSARTVTIAKNSETRTVFRILAKDLAGTAQVNVQVNAMGENFTDLTDITVRPSTSLLKTNGSGVASSGSPGNIDLKSEFIHGSISARLVVSRSPMVQFSKNLDYLVGYPHGCLEQTVSKAFPQLYFAELSEVIGSGNQELAANSKFFVQEAIRKIEAMQVPGGALSYWPGGNGAHWWSSIYAAHFMLEAKKAGYDVNKHILEGIYGFLMGMAGSNNREIYYYYDDARKLRHRHIASKEIFYSMYLLAQAGKKDIAVMNHYKGRLDELALDSRYLLASTYKLIGDQKSYQSVLPLSFHGEESLNALSGSFYSYLRDGALILNALLESDPSNPQIGTLVKRLSEQLKAKRYPNTQECAFSLLALGKFHKVNAGNNTTATITAAGKNIGSFSGKEMVIKKGIAGNQVNIDVRGNGNVYYYWDLEGISQTGRYKEEDNVLLVRKTFFDRSGKRITGNTFKQNDLIVVRISVVALDQSKYPGLSAEQAARRIAEANPAVDSAYVQSYYEETEDDEEYYYDEDEEDYYDYGYNQFKVDNVAITDMLPAGFEIENPRIRSMPGLDWIKRSAKPDYMDIRDDRINLFTTVGTKEKHFYYMVRAVSPGNFRMGPVSADAMYNGEYRSYHGAGIINVVE